MFRILVVEDDKSLRRLFCRTLTKHNFQAIEADHAEEALDVLDTEQVDLIITDIMMPGIDGFEMIKLIRQSANNIPILVITAKGEFSDMETGFRAGADDYMIKPINTNEMILRVQAILKRSVSVREQKLTIGSTTLDYQNWSVTDSQGRQILPQKEFQLLYKMASYPDRTFTRQQLLDDIWGMDYEDSHTLDVHISRLREKIRQNPDLEIKTIRGLGYKVVKP